MVFVYVIDMLRSLAILVTLTVAIATHANDLDEGTTSTSAYLGPFRARDLTPFGFLRLDMRPSHAVSVPVGSWGIETEIAFQNTWALSPRVERYLTSLPDRRELGPAERTAIHELPGENYLFDLELTELEMRLHYKFAEDWAGYAILGAVRYGGGSMDGAIEQFHETLGFSTFGRPALSRNDVNAIFDLKSAESAIFEAPTSGGLLDPTLGIRYTGLRMPDRWKLVLESAIKLPVGGHRTWLSTGSADVGVQAGLQRFSQHHAFFVNASAVYYDGDGGLVSVQSQIVPTLVLGYERRMTARTNLILQAYASDSVYSHRETDLEELLARKYLLTAGVRYRRGGSLVSLALTENVQNINNTPDIGIQAGWAYVPALIRN
ncbi:MAG: DUF3187 family protein [Gammaproteobacteria bacterium]